MAFWPDKWCELVATDDPRCAIFAPDSGARGNLDEIAIVLESNAPTGWLLRGWAALVEAPSAFDQLKLAIFNEEAFFEAEVAREPREDVARALGDVACHHSGYRALIPVEPLPDGEFRLAVQLRGAASTAFLETGHTLRVRDGRPCFSERSGPPLLLVVHVPKSGGTSFRRLLEHGFGEALALHYEEPLCIRPDTRCIQGHMYASSLLRYDPDVRIAMWFRDPVERVISEYFHWRRNPETHPLAGADLLSFARRREMVNLYRRVLDDLSLERLAFVGITEHFEASVELFCRIFDKSSAAIGAHNCNPDKPPGARYGLSDSLRAEIARAQRADLELYERAQLRFRALCRQHGVAVEGRAEGC